MTGNDLKRLGYAAVFAMSALTSDGGVIFENTKCESNVFGASVGGISGNPEFDKEVKDGDPNVKYKWTVKSKSDNVKRVQIEEGKGDQKTTGGTYIINYPPVGSFTLGVEITSPYGTETGTVPFDNLKN